MGILYDIEVKRGNGNAATSVWLTASCAYQPASIVFALFVQDLFGVSMIVPLLPKLINNLGASRALAGLIGEGGAFSFL